MSESAVEPWPAVTESAGDKLRYWCPVCGVVEEITKFLSAPMHRHMYGDSPLLNGLVMLQLLGKNQEVPKVKITKSE